MSKSITSSEHHASERRAFLTRKSSVGILASEHAKQRHADDLKIKS
jgi:hypothetical protein